jgi:fused signal recognition particle receptor
VLIAVVVLGSVLVGLVVARRRRGQLRPPAEELRPNAGADAATAAEAIPPAIGLGGRIRSLFARGVSDGTWRELEEALIRADVGAKAAAAVVGRVREAYRPPQDPAEVVSREIARTFERDPSWHPPQGTPGVIMIVGVNGTGKTTTIGKLASRLAKEGHKVTLAASDTFRAAAGEQLETWAGRSGAQLVAGERGGDPASVAFDAVKAARARGSDVLIVDTAGRLHTREPLMEELRKVRRVIEKSAGEVGEVLLVLDATTGQNGIQQARAFTEAVDVTGIVLAKMDGTARGGIVLAVREELGLPVVLVGTGERAEDLAPFDAEAFARRLVG